MWPWGHAAVGYLLYTTWTRSRHGHPPRDLPTLWLLFGTQFPDLVDKPLAWWFGILPSGRALAHSLVPLVPLSVILYVYFARRGRPEYGVTFAIGALSHALTDALPALLAGEFERARFLLWPLLPHVEYDESSASILGHLASIELSPLLAVELGLGLVVVGVWWRDGMPGLAPIRSFVTERIIGSSDS